MPRLFVLTLIIYNPLGWPCTSSFWNSLLLVYFLAEQPWLSCYWSKAGMVVHTCNNAAWWLTPVTVRHAGSPQEQQCLEAVPVGLELHVTWGCLMNLRLTWVIMRSCLKKKNQLTNQLSLLLFLSGHRIDTHLISEHQHFTSFQRIFFLLKLMWLLKM